MSTPGATDEADDTLARDPANEAPETPPTPTPPDNQNNLDESDEHGDDDNPLPPEGEEDLPPVQPAPTPIAAQETPLRLEQVVRHAPEPDLPPKKPWGGWGIIGAIVLVVLGVGLGAGGLTIYQATHHYTPAIEPEFEKWDTAVNADKAGHDGDAIVFTDNTVAEFTADAAGDNLLKRVEASHFAGVARIVHPADNWVAYQEVWNILHGHVPVQPTTDGTAPAPPAPREQNPAD